MFETKTRQDCIQIIHIIQKPTTALPTFRLLAPNKCPLIWVIKAGKFMGHSKKSEFSIKFNT